MQLRELFVRGAVTGQNPEFLVGRQELIRDLTTRFAEDRCSGVVFGPRGVGKTSIAWQVSTILSGMNSRFPRKQILGLGTHPEFILVVHKCSRYVDTVGDLLVEIIATKSSDYSFASALSPYLSDSERLQSVVRKVSGGIPKIFELSEEEKVETMSPLREATKLFGSESEKLAIFNELVYEISKRARGRRILFMIDEIDRPRDFKGGVRIEDGTKKDLEGVGELIKDSDFAQFLFVGIAENVAEILKDHRSAARKMSGTVIQAPLMTDAEIEEIFKRAERMSHGKLQIAPEFLSLSVKYANGLPWIAQHLGYEAVRNANESIMLEEHDFDSALKKTVNNYAEDTEVAESLEYLEQANRTDLEILGIIWESARGEEELEIRKAIPQRFKQNFDAAIKRLQAKRILVRKGSRLSFKDPIVRVFSRKYIDDARGG
jgi:hypothetical protein